MRLVIDTNILISALLVGSSLPAHLIALWREGRFDLLTSADQIDEMMRVTRYPRIRERLAPPLRQLADELRYSVERVVIRCQRTRWGSCSTRGTVSLNCSLVFLRAEVVRYLFIHELAHLKHMNHSAGFWRLVGTLEPDYRQLDRELLAGWRTVPLWVFKN